MTTEDIHKICSVLNISNYTINDDMSIDVNGDVDLDYYKFGENIKDQPLKFRNVSGTFDCSFNELTSLKGSPSKVGGDFECRSNYLTSLEGGPSYVGGYYWCESNNLTSLEGAPIYVEGTFKCTYNPLKSLKGIPLNLLEKDLFLPFNYHHKDYLVYCRNLKFKKALNSNKNFK